MGTQTHMRACARARKACAFRDLSVHTHLVHLRVLTKDVLNGICQEAEGKRHHLSKQMRALAL